MSTLRAVNIQHPSSSIPSITMDSTGAMTGSFPYPNRNLLYNGAMQVAQRGTSTASITTGAYYTADRWGTNLNAGTWTQSVENDAPTGSGLRKSLKMLVTTAKASLASGDYVWILQQLEGQDVQRVAKGTASAQQLTLSFWVKANATGTYTLFAYDNDNTRMVAASYTISASATWEKKTVTLPADTTGAWDNDNAASLGVYFCLAAGSSQSSGTLQTTWAADVAANRSVGQTNLAAATNNYWQVTGVQLEVGPVATSFEFKSYGQELRECLRYYWKWATTTPYGEFFTGICPANQARATAIYPVRMRSTPTVSQNGNFYVYDGIQTVNATSVNLSTASPTTEGIRLNWSTSGTVAARPFTLIANNDISAFLDFNAEL